MKSLRSYLLLSFIMLAGFVAPPATFAQNASETASSPIVATNQQTNDKEIQDRLLAIYSQIKELSEIQVVVRESVVSLRGAVPNESAASRALDLANRVEGVAAVEDNISRTLKIEDNLSPVVERYQSFLESFARGWPLYLVALLACVLVAAAGYAISSLSRLWLAITPNAFIAQLVTQTIRIAGLIFGILLALTILDAMALFGAAAGGAGLIGLAVGFAVRDTIENYISSVMLSLRQPFRADDHVVINDLEGIVVRLTSRATILMTLDGNHLRIPNAQVFKGIILNYSRNPQRRFDFQLGVDADDNPMTAIQAGEQTLQSLSFILSNPKPVADIREVGDSSIILGFSAWIDQRNADFLKARSGAIHAVKSVLEKQGFTLPEPIYRLRIDGMDGNITLPNNPPKSVDKQPSNKPDTLGNIEEVDVSPGNDVQKQVAEERASGRHEDLLSSNSPVE